MTEHKTPWLSIIIPTLNEAATIARLLLPLQAARSAGVELVMVDGGSADNTVSESAGLVDLCLRTKAGRAWQQNAGAAAASAPLLWFVHADTGLAGDECLRLLHLSQPCWGRFDVRLSERNWRFRLIAGLMNRRSRLTGIATGDQGIFVSADLFRRVGGFPDQPLMEDVEISRRLRRYQKPVCLRTRITTSSRRWQKHGVWRTVMLMWSLRWRYFFGASPAELHARYYQQPDL
ncbi:MAG: glycosyl transferase [Gammaproteobacteria bacterium HGW-Gammaproteobacteria-14]|nr:MAG: glycosyl transferase [Gammaproteobacteria bacterium HGW-Gammaproteobacteria-14]